ncbi:MAG: ABC transporter ATP-binding protein [Nocardioidaceae bacterium]|nr:ABC transporter ATP-binding protein [Nocardioidaceae bacterium]
MSADLDVAGVSFGYRRTSVLADATFRAPSGRLVGLLGPNGCGKSTLLRCIAGVLRPRCGTITLGETDLIGLRRLERARLVAYVPQHIAGGHSLSVADAVQLGRTPHMGMRPTAEDRHQVERAIEALGLVPLARRKVDELSGGQQQKVLIARAIAQQPRVLLLDEPTSALDLAAQVETLTQVLRLLDEEDLGGAMAIHDINLAARFCDRIATLRAGRVGEEGSPLDVLTAPTVERVYGLPVEVTVHRGTPEIRPLAATPSEYQRVGAQ